MPRGWPRLLTATMDQDPELGLFLRLAVVLGARRSELVTLKWRDVDLDAGEVLIASGVVRVAGQPLIDKDTKAHAKRRVAVGAETLELLKATGHGRPLELTPILCGRCAQPFEAEDDGTR
jgi:integrase